MDRLELPETGQVFHAGHAVVAANIWERAPLDDAEAPVGLRAQIIVGEAPAEDVAEGDEVAIGDERWRVEEIVEDAANRRGQVTITRVAD
jgi:hypothetical protein